MESVGIRHLKENLSRYMKRVKAGQPVIVTDRKKEIAIIMPLKKTPVAEKCLNLVRTGVVSWSGKKPKGMADRIRIKGGSVSAAVIEDRR